MAGELDGFYTGTGIYLGIWAVLAIVMPLYAGATTKDRTMVSANKW